MLQIISRTIPQDVINGVIIATSCLETLFFRASLVGGDPGGFWTIIFFRPSWLGTALSELGAGMKIVDLLN